MEAVRIRLLDSFPFPERAALEVLAPAHEGDAGIDLHAAEDAVLLPGERRLVATGIAIALPEGMEAQLRPRSGNALRHGLGLLNSPGTIDPGYRGPVSVLCHNANPPFGPEELQGLRDRLRTGSNSSAVDGDPRGGPDGGRRRPVASEGILELVLDGLTAALQERAIRVQRGERIAQLVFARFERPPLRIVESLDRTGRGSRGFGSTGTIAGTTAPRG